MPCLLCFAYYGQVIANTKGLADTYGLTMLPQDIPPPPLQTLIYVVYNMFYITASHVVITMV